MPVNFNQLAGINGPKAIAELPSAQGGDSDPFSGILEGLGKLMGHSNTPQGMNPQANVNPSPMNPQMGLAGTAQQGVGMNPHVSNMQAPQDRALGGTLEDLYKRPAFQTALQAQGEAMKTGVTKSPVMTVVDYSMPANQPRMWVVDTQQKKVLMNTYVAQGSGGFNNVPGSHGSETGTFLTGSTYHSDSMGRDAMRINGLDKGVNDNAFQRGIVVHGGNYVGKDKSGTSWGCFAVPNQDAPKLIGLTQGGSIIHAYAPDGKSMTNFARQLSPEGQASLSQQIQPIPNAHPELQHTLNGIAGVETPGEVHPYDVQGKATRTGDRALGKYQIMGANVPSWSREALGHPLTKQQFLSDPAAQEKVAAFQINKYLQQGYSPQDAASMWFTGRPLNKVNSNVKDAYGTTNTQYQKKFNQGYLKSKASQQGNTIGPQAYNSIHPGQVITKPTPGIQPPPIPPNVLELIRQQMDKGKELEG